MGMSGVGDLVLTEPEHFHVITLLAKDWDRDFRWIIDYRQVVLLQRVCETHFPFMNWRNVTKLKCGSATQFIKFYMKEYPTHRP